MPDVNELIYRAETLARTGRPAQFAEIAVWALDSYRRIEELEAEIAELITTWSPPADDEDTTERGEGADDVDEDGDAIGDGADSHDVGPATSEPSPRHARKKAVR